MAESCRIKGRADRLAEADRVQRGFGVFGQQLLQDFRRAGGEERHHDRRRAAQHSKRGGRQRVRALVIDGDPGDGPLDGAGHMHAAGMQQPARRRVACQQRVERYRPPRHFVR